MTIHYFSCTIRTSRFTESEFLSRIQSKQRNQWSHHARFLVQTEQDCRCEHHPVSWIIGILSLYGPFCSLFFTVSRAVPVGEATDFNPAWICRGSGSTWTRPFRQYISPALLDGDDHRRTVSILTFVIIINSPKVRAALACSFNDVRNYYRLNARFLSDRNVLSHSIHVSARWYIG